jgi:hypothetical protein
MDLSGKSWRAAVAALGARSDLDKADEYRRRAALCVRLAANITSEREKLAMIDMAQAWLELADRVERTSGPGQWNEPPPPQFEGEEAP